MTHLIGIKQKIWRKMKNMKKRNKINSCIHDQLHFFCKWQCHEIFYFFLGHKILHVFLSERLQRFSEILGKKFWKTYNFNFNCETCVSTLSTTTWTLAVKFWRPLTDFKGTIRRNEVLVSVHLKIGRYPNAKISCPHSFYNANTQISKVTIK